MFVKFFYRLREGKLPVSIREYLLFLEALSKGAAEYSIEKLYYLARASLVKDERYYDRFDGLFSEVFHGIEFIDPLGENKIPEEWLKKLAEKYLSQEEMDKISGVGDWDKLMKMLQERLKEQNERHQGGSKWIGTAGTSPFGAYGYNPEGVRIGQDGSRHRRAVKVWDKREFKNFDDQAELDNRNMKLALRRLRKITRDDASEILDLPSTIHMTANRGGMLDLQYEKERHNAVKVLLFLDVGGSMDDHIRTVENLFSAARSEFKHLEYFYFHNCVYESVWKDNHRRHSESIPLMDVIHTYGSDYKLIFVGDASMSPYEIIYPGAAVEHFNEEAGQIWLQRLLEHFPHHAWLNPVAQDYWRYTQSIAMIQKIVGGRMEPLNIQGIDRCMAML